MSKRYVWDIYDVATIKQPESGLTSARDIQVSTSPKYNAVAATGYEYDSAKGLYKLVGDLYWFDVSIVYINARQYPYIAFIGSDTNQGAAYTNEFFYNSYQESSDEDLLWWFYTVSSGGGYKSFELYAVPDSQRPSGRPSNYRNYSIYRIVDIEQKGENKQGVVSAANSNKYPSNGKYNGLWYEYLGSDSIDPSRVDYSTDSPSPGKTISILVVPAVQTYGGTISYQYSYQINNDAWRELGPKTTDISISLKVPENAETLRARVIASDNLGFSSSTYVVGDVLTVRRMQAYSRINGTAKQIEKMYVNIGGKAREVIAGYARVNGMVRKLF